MMKSYHYDLGSYGRPVTTSNADAKTWFDRGLVWAYGFGHEEAVRCFDRALESDPDCAMAHWGIAYATGPNYNKPWDAFDEVDLSRSVATAHAAIERARASAATVTPVERELIEALAVRFPSATPSAEFSDLDDAYADAMRSVHRGHREDLDVATLFADALITRTPWSLWDLVSGEPAVGAATAEAIKVLETALDDPRSHSHPGLLHMYLHLMEMSPHPERASRAADWLRDLVPDAGHLQHMPTHIDVLCGQYESVVRSNDAAIAADRRYLDQHGALNFYSLYRCHNHHFKLYGAMFLGQLETALAAADEMIADLPEELLRIETPPMADWLEGFVSMKMHVLIRFGRWQDIVATPPPDDHDLYCVTTAMIHYAKGVALAALGRIDEAREQRTFFESAVERVPESRYVFNNSCRDILAVAAAMLDGEIEYRGGDHGAAFAHLRRAIDLDDGLPYDEPWGWMQPTRHAYGALLLEQGRIEEAEIVYRADLGLDQTLARAYQHPDNVWSLHGLRECLTRLGKHAELPMIEQRLDLAMARADVPIESSCYCRLGDPS